MHICPDCKGKRSSFVFVNTGLDSSHHYSEVRKCNRCLGAGYVSQDIINAINQGKKLRKQRIDKGLTLREAALAEGVSVSFVSQRELGF